MNYMKQKFYLLVMALCAMMLVPQRAQADNDYMEVQSHYQVYVAGSDHIHIKAPVFASGGLRGLRCGPSGQSLSPSGFSSPGGRLR